MALDLSFPRRFYVEMFLSGNWQPVGQHVMQSPDITIERGVPNENDAAPPATLEFTLNDSADKGNGAYNPYSPVGPWFGQLTRNVPTRFGLKVGEDAFARTTSPGWGVSPVNGTWLGYGVNIATSTSGGEGRHTVTGTNTFALSTLESISTRDIDVSVSVTIDSVSDVTGGQLEPANIVLRAQDTTHYYLCRMIVSTAEVVTLEIRDVDFQVLAGPVTISPAYTGQQWRVRAQAEGWTIRFKAWPAASSEPLDWQVTAADKTFYPAGWVAIRSGRAAGNTNATPVVFRYDDFELRLPRFEGEATKFVPSADTTMRLKTTAVKCSDVTQRLEQGKSAVKSAMRRSVPSVPGIIAYWPMEDGKFAEQFASGLPNGAPMQVREGTVNFAADDSFANSSDLPDLAVSVTKGAVPSHASPVTYVLRSLLSLPNQDAPLLILAWRLYTTGTIKQWIVQFDTTTHGLDVFAYNNTTAVVFDDANLPSVFDKHIYFSFAMSQSGADINWSIAMIEVGSTVATNISSGTATTEDMGRVYAVELISTGAQPGVVGHVSLGNTAVALSGAAPYVSAFAGDTVAARLARLMSDNGLPPVADLYEITGGSDTMGPMFPDGLLSLIQECATTDHGIMFSPKGDRGISYRRLDSLYDQVPLATLDHAANQLQPGFRPVNDDFTIRNDVTVQRRGGESAEYEVTTGPNNSQDPGTADGAVGRYDSSYTVNTQYAEQAYASAGWLAHLGTANEPRFPRIPVELSSNELRSNTALQNALLDCGPGDVLRLTNLTKWGIYEPADALILGYVERFNTVYRHEIEFNAAPRKPYTVGKVDDGAIRLDSETSTGAATMTASTGSQSMSVATSDPNDLWVTTATLPGEFPFDVVRTGERMTVTAITGASSPQTFTVTRAVNGVVKAHAVDEVVSLADPYYIAR